MPSPDPARIDALLGGDPPRDAGERGIADLVAELRATEGASDALRARVATSTAGARAPAPRRGLLPRLRATGWGRVALVAAPACIVAAAVVVSVRVTSGPDRRVPEAASAPSPARTGTAAGAADGGVPGGRIVTGVALAVDLPHGTDVGAASVATRAIAERLGGSTVSERYRLSRGGTGAATVVLRVPAGTVDTARALIAALGTVRGQALDFAAPSAAPPATGPAATAPAPERAHGPVTVRVTLRAR